MILEPGMRAPEFALVDQFGQTVRLERLRAAHALALVFFPLAFSRTCQSELSELRDNVALFEESGAHFVAISVDSKHTLRAWAGSQAYDFPLLADFWPHGEVARSYGVFDERGGVARRATFLVDVDGAIRASFAAPPGEARSLVQYRDALDALRRGRA
jgi:mycoredoxin-dependent peroxiredoxin